jgi:hypothetical protein
MRSPKPLFLVKNESSLVRTRLVVSERGQPQCGHASALSEISRLHSAHGTRAMATTFFGELQKTVDIFNYSVRVIVV